MGNQWCRLYRETITDPKLSRLSAAQRHVWTVLMCLAIDGDGVAEIADGVGYTSGELATVAGATDEETRAALDWFVQTKMIRIKNTGVITLVNWDHRQFKSDSSAERTAKYREKLQRRGDVTVTDQNRTEQNRDRTEQKSTRKRVPRAPFKPPTLDEVRTYCRERSNQVDAEAWMAFYESNGWKVGRNPMKSWQAAVRTWERNKVGAAKAPAKRFDAGSHETWSQLPNPEAP